jgi:hypothetical protein
VVLGPKKSKSEKNVKTAKELGKKNKYSGMKLSKSVEG